MSVYLIGFLICLCLCFPIVFYLEGKIIKIKKENAELRDALNYKCKRLRDMPGIIHLECKDCHFYKLCKGKEE